MRKRLLRIPYKSAPTTEAQSYVDEFRQKLREFWTRVKFGEPRLSVLIEYAAYRTRFQPRCSYEKRRALKMAEGRRFRECFACLSDAPLVRHHIIQLQHGGPRTTHNIVSICETCHARIHPWLRKQKAV